VLKDQFSENTDTIHFTIQLDETSPSYSCQLVRLPCMTGRCADGFTYRLFVDQTPIMEHAVDAAHRVGVPEDLNTGREQASPPTYYETVKAAGDQLPPYVA